MNAEVVIVGAGFAGLVAANRLAEMGRQVVVLEQGANEDYLCNSRIATGAFNFAHSDPELDPQSLVAAVEADTEGYADPALAGALGSVVGRVFAWLRAEGTEFTARDVGGKRSWVMVPFRPAEPGLDWQGYGPDRLLRRLGDNLRRRGSNIAFGARARDLVMEGSRCVGVEVDFNFGGERIDAGAVVLADGGFQGNTDMVRKHISPHPDALVQRSAGTGRGDAIAMAQRAGARLVDMDRFYGHLLSRVALEDARFWPYPTLDSLTGASILVDDRGRRFLDEGLGGILQSNIIAQRDDPLAATVIFDDAIWYAAGREEAVPPNPTLKNVPGALFSAPDLPGLAQAIGLCPDLLVSTVEAYNCAVRDGSADRLDPPRTPGRRFGARRDSPHRITPAPVETPPFYAAPVAIGITVTMGGIAIDANARALSETGAPIGGLYAVGSTTGGIEGGPAAGYIGGIAKACSLGLIVAETIAGRG